MKRFLISLLVTLVILFVLFTQISLKELFTLFIRIDPLWAMLGFTAYFLATLFRALRFRWLIHSKEISLDELFRISVFYHLSLMVLPSKLGELSYPYLLNRIGGISMTEGLASLIASRVYDFFIVLMIFLFSSGSMTPANFLRKCFCALTRMRFILKWSLKTISTESASSFLKSPLSTNR